MIRTIFSLRISFAILTIGMLTPQLSMASIILDPIDNTVAIRIENLDIAGELFDVDLSRAGESFNDIFGSGDPPKTLVPFFYNDLAGADAARTAIGAALASADINFVGSASDPVGVFMIPTRRAKEPLVAFNSRHFFLSDDVPLNFRITRTFNKSLVPTFKVVSDPSSGAVPEPSSLVVWGFGLGMLLLRRRRRK